MPESAERESVPVRSPSSQATRPPAADTSVNAGVHTTPMNTDDSSTGDWLTDQVGM